MTNPTLILGTAFWAWTIDAPRAFQLLDAYYEAGFRWIDCATNYPINKNPADFRGAEKILLAWIKSNGIDDLNILMKIGSVNNLHTPTNNLAPSFLHIMLQEYRFLFGSQLRQWMIHWDNREDAAAINQSLEAMQAAQDLGLQLGLSGIKHPHLYAQVNEAFSFDFDIQIKHNLLYSDYSRYEDFHGKRRFLTYGMNAGGLKFQAEAYHALSATLVRGVEAEKHQPFLHQIQQMLVHYNQESKRKPIEHFHQCSMVFSFYSPEIKAMLIGPSTLSQLEQCITFYRELQQGHHCPLFDQLLKWKSNA